VKYPAAGTGTPRDGDDAALSGRLRWASSEVRHLWSVLERMFFFSPPSFIVVVTSELTTTNVTEQETNTHKIDTARLASRGFLFNKDTTQTLLSSINPPGLAAVVGLVQARHVHGGLWREEAVLLGVAGVTHGSWRTAGGIFCGYRQVQRAEVD